MRKKTLRFLISGRLIHEFRDIVRKSLIEDSFLSAWSFQVDITPPPYICMLMIK